MKQNLLFRAALVLTALCLLLSGCTANPEQTGISDTAFLLDTSVTITLYDAQDQTLLDACFDEIRRLEALLSADAEGSDIQRINDAAGGAPVSVSSETIRMLEDAARFSALTGGAFDITMGPLTVLWNISGGGTVVPEPEAVAAAKAHVDYRNIEITGNEVRLARTGMRIDPGAIAKGYIGERVKALLLENGVQSALIDLGGNILAVGSRLDGKPFHVGLQKPDAPSGTVCAVLDAADVSVVTAGDYERYFEQDGVRYHHILDPATGEPARSGLSAATIVAADSTAADALSTAVLILGAQKGLALVESLDGIECVLIGQDGTITVSSGLEGKVQIK